MNVPTDDEASSTTSSSDDSQIHTVDPGTAPDEVYEESMSAWRFVSRQFVMRNLRTETELLAKMQNRIRTPLLDKYFVYTSSLGTHTFFLTGLPIFFFFGFLEFGRGYEPKFDDYYLAMPTEGL